MTDFVANPNASWARTRVEILERPPSERGERAQAGPAS